MVVHLIALFCFRVLSAFFAPVMDCDETFNYAEPLHLILYGRGLQTWEYSSDYSLRSYLFLWVYALVGHAVRLLGLEAEFGKVGVLFLIKAVSAFFCSLAQAVFISAVARRFGRRVSNILFFFLLFGPGFSHAGHALLPQSFTMNVLTVAWASGLDASDPRASPRAVRRALASVVVWVAVAGLLGWPFVVFMVLPLGAQALLAYRPWDLAAAAAPAAAAAGSEPLLFLARTESQSAGAAAAAQPLPGANGNGAVPSSVSQQPPTTTVIASSASSSSLSAATLRQRAGSRAATAAANSVAAAPLVSDSDASAANAPASAAGTAQPASSSASTSLPPVSLSWLLRLYTHPASVSAHAHSPLALAAPYTSPEPAPARLRALAWLAAVAVAAAAAVLGASALVDWHYYARFPVVAVWNIVSYNSKFSSDSTDAGAGQQLYGTEPLSYYIKNLAVNFNLAFVLCVGHLVLALICVAAVTVLGPLRVWPAYSRALLGFPAAAAAAPATAAAAEGSSTGAGAGVGANAGAGTSDGAWVALVPRLASFLADWTCALSAQAWILAPLYLWLAVMLPQPHKEERFLYVIYPLICLAAAFSLEIVLAVAQVVADAVHVAAGGVPVLLGETLALAAAAAADGPAVLAPGGRSRAFSDDNVRSTIMSLAQQVSCAGAAGHSLSASSFNSSSSSSSSSAAPGGNGSAATRVARTAFLQRPWPERVALYVALVVLRVRGLSPARTPSPPGTPKQAGAPAAAAAPPPLSLAAAPASAPAAPAASQSADAAAGSTDRGSLSTLRRSRRAPWRRASWLCAIVVFLVYCTLSVSRSFALLYNFSAPAVTYFALYAQVASSMTPGLVSFAAFHTQTAPVVDTDADTAPAAAATAAAAAAAAPATASEPAGPSATAPFDPAIAVAAALMSEATLIGALASVPNYYNLTGRAPLGFARESFPRLQPPGAAGDAPLVTAAGLPLAELRFLAEQSSVARLCVGKDWYRFPSSFYLPEASWTEVSAAELAAARTMRDPRDELPVIVDADASDDAGARADAGVSTVFPLGNAVGRIFGASRRSAAKAAAVERAAAGAGTGTGFFRLVRPRVDIDFIASDFGGVLPQHFSFNVTARSVRGATATPPPYMNDVNRREPSRYVPLAECDFVVDTDLGPLRTHAEDAWGSRLPAAAPESAPAVTADAAAAAAGAHSRAVQHGRDSSGQWVAMASTPLIDTDRSNSWHRAFYVHGLWQRNNRFVPHTLWRRVAPAPTPAEG
jgi:hypothetical protein